MTDYIRREDAKHLLCRFCMGELMCKHHGDCNRMEAANKIPAADVRENVLSRWIRKDGIYDGPSYYCDECGVGWRDPEALFIEGFNFKRCPNCGAEMRGENDGVK